jgi:hypothetical protein
MRLAAAVDLPAKRGVWRFSVAEIYWRADRSLEGQRSFGTLLQNCVPEKMRKVFAEFLTTDPSSPDSYGLTGILLG